METLSLLLSGFSVALQPVNLFACLIGVIAGTLIGALPGLGPSTGVAVLLPLTFGVNPTTAIVMLAGIYYGAMYGGAIASILINTPGDSAAVTTCLDGYPLAQKGRAGAALGMAAFASFIGGTISVIVFTFLAPALAQATLWFGPPEYFALMVMGLSTVSGLTGKSPFKGMASMLIGLALSCVGTDLVTGLPRFCFGRPELYSGVEFITVALGLFGIAELISLAASDAPKLKRAEVRLNLRNLLPNREDWALSWPHILRGTGIGFFTGMLPGAGGTIASFISYSTAKRLSRHPEKFGEGAIEGVAAPESANNAASVGAFVPLLALGVPGSATTAVLMGALMMYNLRPGPLIFERNPEFVWGLISSMYVGNVMLMLLLLLFIPLFVKVLDIPTHTLVSWVVAFILAGSYGLNNSLFDVGITVAFGFLGYLMKRLDYPAAPLVLALVLGNMMENSLRQSLLLSHGSLSIFFTRPLSLVILLIAVAAVVVPVLHSVAKKKPVLQQ
ncbi:MAG: putative tricarboxylic transport rane protein [Bacillota bacterium]|jgi:putative tricarboxylic transport membrane protein|nr:putative tricarboxylic transport rane protein [Bacillota bacterium]